MEVTSLAPNIISCTFLHQTDRARILKLAPWSFKRSLLIIKEWAHDIPFDEVKFETAPFWLQVHNLPPDRMNEQNAAMIGGYVGKFITCDTMDSDRVKRFIRIRSEIAVSSPLKTGFFIDRDGGNKSWIQLKYEKLSDFCYSCGKLGHLLNLCNQPSVESHGVLHPSYTFGPWLRVRFQPSSSTPVFPFSQTKPKIPDPVTPESPVPNKFQTDNIDPIPDKFQQSAIPDSISVNPNSCPPVIDPTTPPEYPTHVDPVSPQLVRQQMD